MSALARRGQAQESSRPVSVRGTARTCVFINLLGAPSHVDTFDLKDGPWIPPDKDLRQVAPRLVLNLRLFPELAKLAGDLCVLRSVRSWEAAHERGQFYVQTGHASNPAFAAETPHVGAVVSLKRGGQGNMPPFLSLNGTPGQGAAFLGGVYEPMAPPLSAKGFPLLQHDYFVGRGKERFDEKYALLEEIDAEVRRTGLQQKALSDYVAFSRTAKKLMYDPDTAKVFVFSAEDEARYGANDFGRACLVARNAIQARNGAVYININNDGWDTHQSMYDGGYQGNGLYGLCSRLDRGVASLLADLKSSGDLKSTLVMMMGEFGRTPGPLNGRAGRDHHKNAQFAVLAGGGIKGGQAIGATDAIGKEIVDFGWSQGRPIYVEDLTATLYSALGINWTTALADTPSKRQFSFIDNTKVEPFVVEEAFL